MSKDSLLGKCWVQNQRFKRNTKTVRDKSPVEAGGIHVPVFAVQLALLGFRTFTRVSENTPALKRAKYYSPR